MAYHPHVVDDNEAAAHVSVLLNGDRCKANVSIMGQKHLIDAGYDRNDGSGGHFYDIEVTDGNNGNEVKVALIVGDNPPPAMLLAFDAWTASRAP